VKEQKSVMNNHCPKHNNYKYLYSPLDLLLWLLFISEFIMCSRRAVRI